MRRRAWLFVVAVLFIAPLFGTRAASPGLSTDTTYSSGWRSIHTNQVTVLNHTVDTTDPGALAVDLLMRDERPGGLGVHRWTYGGLEDAGEKFGMYWQGLTESQITVVRLPDDLSAGQYLMRMWVPPSAPQYDSGWFAIGQDQAEILYHNLGGDPADYVPSLVFRNATNDTAVHHIYYGGMLGDGWAAGGAFANLDDERVIVIRRADDLQAVEMRMRIYAEPPSGQPDYDSGWIQPALGASTVITHGLDVPPGQIVVRMSQRSPSYDINSYGVGGMESGGMYVGAAWHNLTDETVQVWRGAHDPYAPEVRLRLWTFAGEACVPEMIEPAEGAVVDNGGTACGDLMVWPFSWSGCPGAEAYHLYVAHPPGTPAVDLDDLVTTSYTHTVNGFVQDGVNTGWEWRVRARVDGAWGDWSPTRTFSVEPANADCSQDVYVPYIRRDDPA